MRRQDQIAEARKLLAHVSGRTTALADGVYRNPVTDYTSPQQGAREREVFFKVAAGASNAEVAAALHMSEGTVKVHVGRILAKFELRDRVQIVVLGYESGLITPSG